MSHPLNTPSETGETQADKPVQSAYSDYGFCRVCGYELPPGGQRVVGVCDFCVGESNERPHVFRIPFPSYRMNRG